MEIGPIAAIRAVSGLKPRSVDSELTALFDIESSARAGDDTYTGNGKKAAGAEENDEEDLENEDAENEDGANDDVDDPEEISASESSITHSDHSASQISFFA